MNTMRRSTLHKQKQPWRGEFVKGERQFLCLPDHRCCLNVQIEKREYKKRRQQRIASPPQKVRMTLNDGSCCLLPFSFCFVCPAYFKTRKISAVVCVVSYISSLLCWQIGPFKGDSRAVTQHISCSLPGFVIEITATSRQ
mmetsp:Transcript_15721/g.23720  ORF Transcript_15721/g.23720 Transcript_15721/m.23720 type:complete len:140 (+) Transcript_15721:129-548(+)